MRRKISPVLIFAWLLLCMTIFILAEARDCQAVPAFARKYRMSCTTCHAPFPKLKDYGDEFAGNGFVLKDKDAPRYTVETGDSRLDLIREIPLAVRLEGFVKYQSETDKEVDLTTPYNLKLISGGSLTKNFAYYFYFFLSERGEVAGIEDAYIMFNNLFNSELDIYFGQFQVSDPLFKREVRLTYEDYPVYKMKVGASGINLAYDRGVMITYGFETGTDIIFEITNGNGIGEADVFRTYDDDKYKCFVGRLSQNIGEYFRVGGFGYYGKEKSSEIGNVANEVKYLGPDFTFAYAPIELNVQYLERWDSRPIFYDGYDMDIESRGAIVELVYTPEAEFSKWCAVGLFNWTESDFIPIWVSGYHEEITGDYLNYKKLTAHFGYVFRTNIRFFIEYTRDLNNDDDRLVTGFVTAF